MSMKVIGLGDTHGRNIWKEITAKEEDADKIIFIGDFFDTHDRGHSPNRQIENFKDIIAFKKANMDKIILLFGNHDFHYLKGIGENYSGYQAGYAHDIGELLHEALASDLMQMCYKHDKFLFSHAGVTKTWCKNNDIDLDNIEQSINDQFKFKPNTFKFTSGANFSNTGDDVTQPPIWVRPQSLYGDMVDDVICVVGHTTVKTLDINPEFNKLIMIDCLGTSGEYLVITDGVANKLK